MTRETVCLWLALLLCVGQAVAYIAAGRSGMAFVYGSYALANIGFIWDATGG